MTEQEAQFNALIRSLETNTHDPNKWLDLGKAYLENSMWLELKGLFGERNRLFGDGAELLFYMLLMENGIAIDKALTVALSQYENIRFETWLDIVLSYACGCVKINSGEIDAGRAIFLKIGNYFEENPQLLSNNKIPHLKELGWLAQQFHTFTEIESYQNIKSAYKPEKLKWVDEPNLEKIDNQFNNEEAVIFCCCDVKYLEKYGKKFIEKLNLFGPIHIHIVNGDPIALKHMALEYSEVFISFSIEEYKLNGGSPYYASVRFLRVREVMNKFNRDVAMLDIDVEDLHDFERLLNISKSHDITLFGEDTIVPWLKDWATYIYYKNSAKTKDYQRLTENCFLHVLDGAKWFIDQSMLNCINQYTLDKYKNFDLKFLSKKDGFSLLEFIAASGSLEEKKGIRENASYD